MNFVFETVQHVDNDVHVKLPNALPNASYQFSWLIFSAELVIYASKCHCTCKSTTPQVTYMCHLTLKAFLQPILKIYLDLMTSNIMADFFGQILEQKITFFFSFLRFQENRLTHRSLPYMK